jgi:hypothetical protein
MSATNHQTTAKIIHIYSKRQVIMMIEDHDEKDTGKKDE